MEERRKVGAGVLPLQWFAFSAQKRAPAQISFFVSCPCTSLLLAFAYQRQNDDLQVSTQRRECVVGNVQRPKLRAVRPKTRFQSSSVAHPYALCCNYNFSFRVVPGFLQLFGETKQAGVRPRQTHTQTHTHTHECAQTNNNNNNEKTIQWNLLQGEANPVGEISSQPLSLPLHTHTYTHTHTERLLWRGRHEAICKNLQRESEMIAETHRQAKYYKEILKKQDGVC